MVLRRQAGLKCRRSLVASISKLKLVWRSQPSSGVEMA